MLVLGRKANESLVIGDGIVVTVLAVEGERVKIGIEAPPDVQILRHELYEALKAENLRAASLPSDIKETVLPSLRELFHQEKHADESTDAHATTTA